MQLRGVLLLLGLSFLVAAQDTSCSATRPCLQGCCSKYGQCGFGDDFCKDGCQGTCDAKPECGDGADSPTCPLGVCCSKYGFCGTTADFCGANCQNGCEEVPRPSCDASTDVLNLKRRIGYYGMFNLDKTCDRFLPEHIAAGPMTHINLAFVNIGSDFKLQDDSHQADIINRVAHLKDQFPGLRVNIAVGGWNFNDPPTQHIFSDLMSTTPNQMTFIESVESFLTKYGLDGIDIDWEYPVANDRGGRDEDYDNFVVMLARLRESFDRNNPGYEISITLPSSYWYLRGFNLKSLQKHVDYFNVMTYDLHGMWDQHNRFTGPYLKGHTNVTEIEMGLDLLWRNGVDHDKVVMGFGFYGRSFTMSDSSCHDPTKGCTFSAAGIPGDCSDTAGILTYSEIMSRNTTLDAKSYYDAISTVKYTTYGYDQWVSYDDEQSFADKKKYLNSRCLGGLMIWAIDQDSQNYDALSGLLGQDAVEKSLFESNQLTDGQKEQRSTQFAAFTGQDCFVTEVCTDGTDKESGPDQKCPAGTVSVSTAHAPLQQGLHTLNGDCSKGWYRHICCPSNEVPKNCEWTGAPVRSEIGCSGKCSSNQFELNTDTFTDAKGNGQCYQGHRSLCCDSADLLHDCFWTDCQGPLREDQMPGELGTPGCPADTNIVATRYDTDNGGWCSRDISNSPLHSRFKRALCCPKKEAFTHCAWDNYNLYPPKGEIAAYHPCTPGSCYKTQTKIAQARQPGDIEPRLYAHRSGSMAGQLTIGDLCTSQPIPAGHSDEFSLCCDPPSEYTERWPVPPHYLWANAFENEDDDVAWTFADNYGNNNADKEDNDIKEEPGKDPYGFIMLDGGPESLSNSFGSDFTVARRSLNVPKTKRSLLTNNQTVMDATFEHAEETVHVFCNHPAGSAECERPFLGGAPDTIISLPPHIGEGPYARIVSMDLADEEYNLPKHHVRARSVQGNTNPVYRLTFDYNFHKIRDDKGPVNMRIDYTNLLPYWDEVTASEAKRKRQEQGEPLSNAEWKERIKRATKAHSASKRSVSVNGESSTMMGALEESHLAKRWFGSFLNWLKKLNTVESKDKGFLEMILAKSFLLYDASVGCLGRGYYARMQMFLDTKVEMDATYAYYFTGTIVPPKIDQTFAYLGLEPSAYLGLRIQGNAELYYESERKKLIDTLTYPGLSIKGIAVVGPSLDIYGQIRGRLTLSGQIRAGATATFGKAELYFPQGSDADSSDVLESIPSSNTKPPDSIQLQPEFHASAQAVAALQILVTPEAKLGLTIAPKILGSDLVTLVDAQLIGFVNGTLEFSANVTATAGTGEESTFTYGYGAYLYYNLGYGGYANLLSDTWNWKFSSVYAYPVPGKQYTIYANSNLQSDNTINSRRSIGEEHDWPFGAPSRIMGRAILNDESRAILKEAASPEKIRSLLASSGEKYANETSGISTDRLFFGKRADGDGSAGGSPSNMQNPAITTGGQKFTCPPRGARDVTLPDFRYNCLVFSSSQLTGSTGSLDAPGICDGITQFFGYRALSSNGLTLTYEPSQRDARDKLVCGSSFCLQTNLDLRRAVGLPPRRAGKIDLTSCDEFPFGSAEEGGDFFPVYASRKSRATSTCVPIWQQSLQGNCNKLFGKLNTNIAYFDAEQGQNVDAVWKNWALKAWINKRHVDADDVPAFERLTHYPEVIPLSPGVYSDEWSSSDHTLGKNFKRNYTFGLAYTNNVADTEWGSQAFIGYNFVDGNVNNGLRGTDATSVACAINTFGQPDVFRWDDSGWNGFCFRAASDPVQGWGTPPSFARCKIDFQGSTFANNVMSAGGTTKRDEMGIIGNFSDHGITGIQLDPSTEHDIIIDDGWLPSEDDLIPLKSYSAP